MTEGKRVIYLCLTEDEALDVYRRVRDEIKAFVEKLPEALMV